MAIHRLDSEEYQNLLFHPEDWKGVETDSIGDLVNNFYPPITKITSLSENKAFRWFFGRVIIKGKGKVEVKYPYSEEHLESFTLRNIDFSTIPYILLEAKPVEGYRFEKWVDRTTGTVLSTRELFLISEGEYDSVTSFGAYFTKE